MSPRWAAQNLRIKKRPSVAHHYGLSSSEPPARHLIERVGRYEDTESLSKDSPRQNVRLVRDLFLEKTGPIVDLISLDFRVTLTRKQTHRKRACWREGSAISCRSLLL